MPATRQENVRPNRPRKRRWRRWVLIAGLLLLLAGWAARPVLERSIHGAVVEALASATGDEVTLAEARLGLLPLRLELEGLRVLRDGRALAEVPHLSAVPSPSELLQGRVRITRLEVDSPILHLGDGGLEIQSGGDAPPAEGPDLVIDQFRIDGGEVHWASGGESLSLTGFHANSAQLLHGGSGLLELGAVLKSDSGRAMLVDRAELSARVRLTPSGLRVDDFALERDPELRAHGRARLSFAEGDGEPEWKAEANIDAGDELLAALDPAIADAVRAGRFALGVQGGGTLSDWTAKATLSAPDMQLLALPNGPLALRELSARLLLFPSGLVLEALDSQVAGGRLHAEASLPLPAAEPVLSVTARLEDLVADEIPGAEAMPSRQGATLSGELSARIPLSAPSTSRGSFELHLVAPEAPGQQALSLDVSAEADADGLSVREALFRMAAVRAQASGSLAWDGRSRLRVEASTTSLDKALRGFVAPSSELRQLGLDGALTLDGEVTGTPSEPKLDARLRIVGLALRGERLGDLVASLRADREALTVSGGSLRGEDLHLDLRGRLPFASPASSEAEVSLRRLDLAAISRLAGQPESASGTLAGTITVEPGRESPRVRASIGTELATVAGVQVEAIRLVAALDEGLLTIDEAAASLAGGTLRAEGRLSLDPDQNQLSLRADSLDLERLPINLAELIGTDVAGLADLELVVGGEPTAPVPRGPARWSLRDFVLSGRELGRVDGELVVEGSDYLVRLAGFDGALRGSGRLGSGDAAPIEAHFELDTLDLTIEAGTLGPVSVRGAGMALDVSGSLRKPEALVHSVSLAGLEVENQGHRLRSVGDLTVTGTGPTLVASELALSLDEHPLFLDGTVTLGSPLAHDVHVRGSADLQLLESMLPDVLLEGEAEFDLRSAGRDEEQELSGELRIAGAQFRVRDFPHAFEDVRLEAVLEPGRLSLRQATAQLGGGFVTGSGHAELEGFNAVAHAFRLRGEDVTLRLQPGLTTTSSFDLALEGDPEGSLLAGSVELLEARFTRDLKLETSLASPGKAPRRTPVPGPLDGIRLDLKVNAESGLVMDNDLAAVELAAELEVVGTASRPVLAGQARTLDDGRLTFQRARYRLLDGSAVFTLAHPNDPELSALAETRLADHDIELRLSGRLSDPRIELSSTPDLPPERIVALLATGGAVGGGPSDAVPAEIAADFLKGRMGKVNEALRRFAGVDIFELDPVLAQGQADHVARLTVGKKLTPRVTAIVSTDLGGDSNSSASLRYQATKALSVRAARESTGANALSATWTRAPRKAAAKAPAGGDDGFLLGELRLTGLPSSLDEAKVRKALDLKAGARVTDRDLRRIASRLRTAVQEKGRALARVRCEADGESAADQVLPVPVRCDIQAGPELLLVLEGPLGKKLTRRIREAVELEWRELFRLKDLMPEAIEATSRELAARGHGDARVSASEDGTDEQRVVTVRVEPGPKLRVSDYEFPGAGSLAVKRLESAARSAASPTLFKPPLTPDFLSAAAAAIGDLYRSEGWLEAKAGPASWHLASGESAVTMSVPVVEGERLHLEAIDFKGKARWTEGELRARIDAKLGEPVDSRLLDEAVLDLVAAHDGEGHPDASARWAWKRGEGGALVTVTVDEGRRFEIGAIEISGNRRTREAYILRTAGLKPGQLYGRDRLAEARRRLSRTGLFERVSVQGRPPGEGPQRAVAIELVERDPLRLSVGGGVDDQEGAHFTFAVSRTSRTGVNLAGNLRLGDIDRVAEIVASVRDYRGGKTDLLASLGQRSSDEPGFLVRKRGLALQASRPGPWGSRLEVRSRLEDVDLREIELSDVDPGLDEGLFLELGSSVSRDTRDATLAPTGGRLISASGALGLGLDGENPGYARFFLRHASFHQLRPGLVYSASLRLGVGWAIKGPRLPLTERFRAGGVTTLRGFARDSLGPRDAVTNEPLGGDAMLLMNQELSLQLGGRLTFHAFFDAGNVYDDLSALGGADLRLSTGIGLGLVTPLGPLRLYHAWLLDPKDHESATRLHFAITSAF